MDLWSRFRADAPTAFLYAFAALVVTTAVNALGKAYGWLTTPPKHGPAPLMTPITVPLWALAASVAVFILWFVVRAIRPKRNQVPVPQSSKPAPTISNQQRWDLYAIPRPLGSRGLTSLSAAQSPSQKFSLRWGEFQEIKWVQAEVQVRVDHLGLLRRGGGAGQYAVKQKIMVQTEAGNELSLVIGSDVVPSGQRNEYIVPISQVGLAYYSTMPGSIAYIGNPSGHYPDFVAFTMCVRSINSETGEAQIEAFFGGKLQ